MALLGFLDLLPVGDDIVGGVDAHAAEDVRMPVHQLVVHAPGDIGDCEGAGLCGQDRVDHDLEQEVAELVLERVVHREVGHARRGRVGRQLLDGLCYFVRLFEDVPSQ